jgi:hypothetical protein
MAYSWKTSNLFGYAIMAERKMQDFYFYLAEKFSDLEDVSTFWLDMMNDEIIHERELERVYRGLKHDQIFSPADPRARLDAIKSIKLMSSANLKHVETLEDAYKLAVKFENSEINPLFLFLTNEFISGSNRKRIDLTNMEDHIKKLEKLPKLVQIKV